MGEILVGRFPRCSKPTGFHVVVEGLRRPIGLFTLVALFGGAWTSAFSGGAVEYQLAVVNRPSKAR